MKNKSEQFWKDLQGKVLHIVIRDVHTWIESSIKISVEIVELGEYIDFEVDIEED